MIPEPNRSDALSMVGVQADFRIWQDKGARPRTAHPIEASAWLAEMRNDTPESTWEMHHYMIYLDSAGCFEVIAASCEVLPEEAGPKIRNLNS
jgi:hypothetical protein